MASKRTATATQSATPGVDYWSQRLTSRGFRQSLVASLEAELRHLATLKFADIIDRELVGQIIEEWDITALNRDLLMTVILTVADSVGETLRQSTHSAQDLLGRDTGREIETLLFDRAELSGKADGFLSDLMQQEFTQLLFTEIIFTSIVSFNKKVNPIFGGFAMRAMEDQIRGFIRLFMPMVQKQAASFAVDNQAALHDLMRQMLLDGLQRPLGELVREPSRQRRQAGEALLRHSIASNQLDQMIRACAGVGWDAAFAALRHRTLGEIVKLDKHAKRWAQYSADLILPLLSHAPFVELVAHEAELAHTATKSRRATKLRARVSPSGDDSST